MIYGKTYHIIGKAKCYPDSEDAGVNFVQFATDLRQEAVMRINGTFQLDELKRLVSALEGVPPGREEIMETFKDNML